MFDQTLGWAVVILPTLFALGVEMADERIRKHRFWKWAVVAFGVGISALTWMQQSRALRAAAADRESAITETSERVAASTSASVTKAIADEYQSMITDLTSQIQSLRQQLIAQGKDVTAIKGSEILSGKGPLRVEVMNPTPQVTTNLGTRVPVDEGEVKMRQDIGNALGRFEAMGVKIRNNCLAAKPNPFPCEQEANKWYGDCITYIKSSLQSSYADRFTSASGLLMSYNAAIGDEHLNQIANDLTFKVNKLEEFIKELVR